MGRPLTSQGLALQLLVKTSKQHLENMGLLRLPGPFNVESKADLGASLCCIPGKGFHISQYSGFVVTVLFQKDINMELNNSDHKDVISSGDTF